MADIAYKRVSTTDQKHDRQLAGHTFDKEFAEHISGSLKDRPALDECLAFLREGDTLHVHSIDRLARNLGHLQNMVEGLVSRGIKVHFHKEQMVFTNESNGMAKFMLQMMGAFAEFERNMIRERQAEGIKIAKEQGKYKGRKPLGEEKREQVRRMLARNLPKNVIANACGVAVGTVYNIKRQLEQNTDDNQPA